MISNIAPAHPHATLVAMNPALFSSNWIRFSDITFLQKENGEQQTWINEQWHQIIFFLWISPIGRRKPSRLVLQPSASAWSLQHLMDAVWLSWPNQHHPHNQHYHAPWSVNINGVFVIHPHAVVVHHPMQLSALILNQCSFIKWGKNEHALKELTFRYTNRPIRWPIRRMAILFLLDSSASPNWSASQFFLLKKG